MGDHRMETVIALSGYKVLGASYGAGKGVIMSDFGGINENDSGISRYIFPKALVVISTMAWR